MQENQPSRITGIGNVLVDVLINESDRFLSDLGKEKGGMTLVDNQDIETILTRTDQRPQVVPGGACCNTILGVGMLGGDARFIGNRGNDDFGNLFENSLKSCGVDPRISMSGSPTGKALSVITPDAQRSMFTFLGASVELAPGMVTPDLFENTAIAMIEGYLLFNPELMTAAVNAAKSAGASIAVDLASFEVVNASKDILDRIVKDDVDILIANEDEALAFTGHEDEQLALEALSEHVTYGVLKVGKRGSFICHGGHITQINPVSGKDAVDTTGAGDLWAAGFLYGIAHGLSVEHSGALGSACGYEVCQVIGAQIPEAGWHRIKDLL
ncbi:MAG: adenosine kinase [Desulfobacteraceae bacterium]|nr:MAG: adenosine kinase [Desulfobacteraceae bacterium]